MERSERAKVKKKLIKELQLFRLEQPTMQKKEYHERLRKIEETEDFGVYSRNSPRALLSQVLLRGTQLSPPAKAQSEESSIIVYKASSHNKFATQDG